MSVFGNAASILLFDQEGGRLTFQQGDDDQPHRLILRILFAVWFVTLFRRFIWDSLRTGRYGGGDLQHGETRARKMTTAHKIISSFTLVITGFVLLDGLCHRFGTDSSSTGVSIRNQICEAAPAGSTLSNSEYSLPVAAQLERIGNLWTDSIVALSFGSLPTGNNVIPTSAKNISLGYAELILLGLIFGFCGDVALVYRRTDPKSKSKGKAGPLLAGIFFFALGHISYVLAFNRALDVLLARHGLTRVPESVLGMMMMGGSSNDDSSSRSDGIIFAVDAAVSSETAENVCFLIMNALRCIFYPIGLIAWFKSLYGGSFSKTTALGWIGGLYTVLIAETATRGTILSFIDPQHFLLLGVGLFLFMISDIGVARSAFKGQTEVFGGLMHISDFIWATYGPAQCFIGFSIHALYLSLLSAAE